MQRHARWSGQRVRNRPSYEGCPSVHLSADRETADKISRRKSREPMYSVKMSPGDIWMPVLRKNVARGLPGPRRRCFWWRQRSKTTAAPQGSLAVFSSAETLGFAVCSAKTSSGPFVRDNPADHSLRYGRWGVKQRQEQDVFTEPIPAIWLGWALAIDLGQGWPETAVFVSDGRQATQAARSSRYSW